MEQAVSSWQSLRARLLQADPELATDEAALSALLGGEQATIAEMLERLLKGANFAESMANAAKLQLADLTERKGRYERRAQAMRGTAFAIMEVLGEKKMELPGLTASIGAGAQAVFVTDEDKLPPQFLRTTTEPDKAAIGAALKAGEEVEGAFLGNGLPKLTIRTK